VTDVEASAAPPSSRRALGDILVQVVGRLANGVLGVAVLVIIARLLGTEEFGRWSTLLAIIVLSGPLTELGITQVAVARAAGQPRHEPEWLGALLAVRTILALVATVLCIGTVLALSDGGEMALAGVLLSGTVLLAGLGASTAVFQLRTRNDLTVLSITANSVVWTIAVVAVGLVDGGLVPLAACFLGAATATLAFQVVLALRHTTISLDGWRSRGRELVRVGLPLSIGTILVLAYGRADQLMVYGLAGELEAGLYGAAYRILDQSTVIPMSVTVTLYPILVRAWASDPARVHFLLQRALEVLVAIGLGALAFAIPCGGDALALLFGDEFRAAGPSLAILMGVFLLICVNYLNGSVVLMLDLQKRVLAYSAVGLVVNITLNFLLIPPYGYVAAAWATLVTEVVVVVLTGRATIAAMGWRPDLPVILRAAVAAAITCVVLTVLAAADTPIGLLLVLTPLLYGGLLVLLRGVRLAETIAIVRRGADG
jgi:O-antigen/teichoic acid export membrane protein